jgi:hypothetical protein
MLRRAVPSLGGLSREEVAEVPGLADDLRRARTAIRLHGEMWQAQKEGDHLGAITRADELVEVLPAYTTALEVRRRSAEELEARAEGHVVSHEYESAEAVLESLRRVWPEREGVAERIAWCRERIEEAHQAEAAIQRAVARGDAGDPEGGLEALAAVRYDPQQQEVVDRARTRLEGRLAELDAAAPTVEIASDVSPAFKKNQSVTVPLTVTDDLRVVRVVVWARNESDDGYLEIPLQPAGGGRYDFVVTPELHDNQNVFFYVEAFDPSGHVGRLGTSDSPQSVERSRWFKKILK